jgi:hypothetical protein
VAGAASASPGFCRQAVVVSEKTRAELAEQASRTPFAAVPPVRGMVFRRIVL